jgi:type II secretory pathway pseudopilin PulG
MKKKTGFTLIEIVVVVASVGLIMTSVIGLVLGTFKAQNREKATNKVMENGSWIINELRKNTLNSESTTIVCTANDSIEMVNMFDQEKSIFSCNRSSNKIASTSAIRDPNTLNSDDVNITDCSNFVECEKDSSGKVSNIIFNFGIGATTSGVSVAKNFNTVVTVRN